MARKQGTPTSTGRTVLVVDDSQEYLVAAERLLRRSGHSVIAIDNPLRALELLRSERVDLVLVDFFMPEMTGEQFVAELRRIDPLVHVILQTGYASEQPPRSIVERMDIQGYHDKSEGPDKLLLWADLGLRSARAVQALERSRAGLRYVLSASMELHRKRPVSELMDALLEHASVLARALEPLASRIPEAPTESVEIATSCDVFLTFGQATSDFAVRAGTGMFRPGQRASQLLLPREVQLLEQAVRSGRTLSSPSGTAVPLAAPDGVIGALYFDRPVASQGDLDLLHVFACHAAIALENALFHLPSATTTPPAHAASAQDDAPPTERTGSAA